ncbi:UDP-3-O-acyl-N-acetylglucosamine deacetylase [Criblamydia sequanensis]|uniref:UDP-3-O-acyl-N-acetylglucosamine deacetylase n=1 Tax=Candidatus Criblamydia sequanensis CRIB-18 TaxID=1437425 RepID=A0A090DVP9_9BACT|nr:UDP-3-O-acyl-N-acetylglucosamine deacetylase [Criblamydia sequanensis]CDR33044.1 UDP-3-O-[3-hydroxymyristoyl] N-acetylglucosamine deacetylase [Criblamydia sequanensis CRIB-18]
MDEPRGQQTILNEAAFSGIGIHTGRCVSLKFCPAPENTGVVFKRMDLPSEPVIPATVEYVVDTERSTTLGLHDVRIHTVEHVLAAVRALGIDNLIIELTNIEPPAANGGSDIFVDLLEQAKIVPQKAEAKIVSLKYPVFVSHGDIHLVALPYKGFKISYTLSYTKSQALHSQYGSFEINPEIFKREIAPCRTFALYEEVSHLMDLGLIKGGSLDNAVIIKEDVIFSKGGLAFQDEMVRHKILDLVGDLSLVGFPFEAHIVAIRSGHSSNCALAKKILNSITMENTRDVSECFSFKC